MKKVFSMLAATLMSVCAMSEVNYQTIPLAKLINIDATGKQATIVKGTTAVTYTANNAQMKRNAEFAKEFLGVQPIESKKAMKEALNLTTGLQSENPDAYRITVDKKGITIQGASESGVFYGLQTLR